MNNERTARDELEKQWMQFSAAHRNQCLSLVNTGGVPSYVELLSCLEMSRDAARISQGQPIAPPYLTGAGTDRPSVGPPRNRMQPRP